MKPTVSDTRMRGLVSGWRARTVVSSVAKSLSATSTSLAVSARIKRRLAGVGVADQRHPARVAAVGAAHALLLLDGGELLAQLGDAVADLAPIQLQRGLAGALAADAAALPIGAARLPQAGGDVVEARDLHLEPGLPAAGVAVEDLDDDAGPIEHLGAGGALQVARLAGRDLVVDDHHRRRAGGLGAGLLGGVLVLVVVRRVGVVAGGGAAGAGLVLLGRGAGGDGARAAGELRELPELALAEDRGGREGAPLLRDGGDHLVPERVHEAAELGEVGGVIDVADVGELHGHEDGGGAFGGGVRHAGSPAE